MVLDRSGGAERAGDGQGSQPILRPKYARASRLNMRIAKSTGSGQGGILAQNPSDPFKDIVVAAPVYDSADVPRDSLGPFKQRCSPPRLTNPTVGEVFFLHYRIRNHVLSVDHLNVVDKTAGDSPDYVE